MDNSSGVGVLDKAALVLGALEAGPATLAALVSATGLARPTAHRLAVALEHHRLVARDLQGRFVLGPRLAELSAAAGEDRLLAVVERGTVTLHIDGAQHELHEGDTVTFDADLAHRFENPGPGDAVLLAVVSAGLRRS